MPDIKNLEAGIERAMKAYLKERGVSDAAAAQRTKAKLAQAVTFVRAKFAESNDVEPDPATVFAQLKTWTLANA